MEEKRLKRGREKKSVGEVIFEEIMTEKVLKLKKDIK